MAKQKRKTQYANGLSRGDCKSLNAALTAATKRMGIYMDEAKYRSMIFGGSEPKPEEEKAAVLDNLDVESDPIVVSE